MATKFKAMPKETMIVSCPNCWESIEVPLKDLETTNCDKCGKPLVVKLNFGGGNNG